MKKIEELATFVGLRAARSHRNTDITEMFLRRPDVQEQLGLKRVQFETTSQLYEELDQVCSLFDVSKREFLESALIDALAAAQEKFHAVFEESTGCEFGSQEA